MCQTRRKGQEGKRRIGSFQHQRELGKELGRFNVKVAKSLDIEVVAGGVL
jgi:hypothetical protein